MEMISKIVQPFNSESFSRNDLFTHMGKGSLGAKANGIARAKPLLNELNSAFGPQIKSVVPLLTVIATDHFECFLQENNLHNLIESGPTDFEIEQEFQRATFSSELRDNLSAFLGQINVPLAVRSSSLLEDGINVPFAGIYDTGMIPNNHPDIQYRLQALERAIKHIYASTFFQQARQYREAANCTAQEKMAVIIQEVMGARFGNRFYPHISGIAKSFNFYPTGLASPEDGLIGLALGLGRIIVTEGKAWYYSPAYPQANPPYKSIRDLLTLSQKDFWAIDMGGERAGDGDYVKKYPLTDADRDGTLALSASTYIEANDKIVQGISEVGPRLLDFARILKTNVIPLNEYLKKLLAGCENLLGAKANIEFAATVPHNIPSTINVGFLQMRPMALYDSMIELTVDELGGRNVLLASESCLGNGTNDSIADIVYTPKEKFNAANTGEIAAEIEKVNSALVATGTPYVLMGFGRWGSSDPSAGIPINFGQLSGAKVIVEMTLPSMDFFTSQGSHFFHNIISHKILYFSLGYFDKYRVDWNWLNSQPEIQEYDYIRHIRTQAPVTIKVDGRTRRGVIIK